MMLTTENQRHDLTHLVEQKVSCHLVKPIGTGDLSDALALAEGVLGSTWMLLISVRQNQWGAS